MITCIGTGGHARALELPQDTMYMDATPEDIRAGRVEVRGSVVIGVGHPFRESWRTRQAIVEALRVDKGCTFPSYHIGEGFEPDDMGRQVFRRVHVGPGVSLGAFCVLNTGCIVEHDVSVGDYTHIAPGAVVCGGARIGSGCLIGAGAVVLPGVVVPDNTMVKAGEVRK